MKQTLRFMLVSAFALLILVPAAFAQVPQVSTLPVSEPLDVGGTILQPGTYTIRVLPTQADRNRVQITSTDLNTIYATVLTIPHDLEPNEKVPNTTFVYYPAGEGTPRALRTWFPPDTQWKAGKDIVYEESRARQLARLGNESVPSYQGEITDTTTVQVITPQATVEAYVPPPAPMVTEPVVAPEPVAETEPEPMAPMTSAQPVQTADTTPMEIPQTAGNVPLMALLGLLAVGAALTFRFARHG